MSKTPLNTRQNSLSSPLIWCVPVKTLVPGISYFNLHLWSGISLTYTFHTAYPIPSHTELTHLSDLACPSDLVCSSDLACPCCTPHIWHIVICITQCQHSLHYKVGLHILKVPRVPSHSVPKSSTFSESIDKPTLKEPAIIVANC